MPSSGKTDRLERNDLDAARASRRWRGRPRRRRLAGGQRRLAGPEGGCGVFELRTGEQVQLGQAEAAVATLDRAVAADPVAGRRLGRAEMLLAAALTPSLAGERGATRRNG